MEAICFGWIDTTVKRVDEERYGTHFVKRGKNARWSTNTLSYAEELIRQNKMTKQGLEAYELGKTKPILESIPKGADPSPDMLDALRKNKTAYEYFEKLSPSARHVYISWVEKAKRSETRQKRITIVVERCSQQKKW